MVGIDLFQWWAATISAGSIFLAVVGGYLYVDSRARRKKSSRKETKWLLRSVVDFIFVWVLLGLSVFYIVSINLRSDWIFAVGNILVEAFLILYVITNRTRKSEEA